MQSGMSMDDFLAEVSRRENAKKDYMVNPKSMMMANDNDLLLHGGDSFRINSVAHQQISAKFDIPKKFYDELPGRLPGLRTTVVNGLLSVDKERRLVRTLDGEARALLSDRFRPIDNFLVMQAVIPTLKQHKDLRITSLQLSDTRMYLQVVFPKITGEVKVGQPVQAGMTITNSEVGHGSQDVRSFIYVLRCSNGMVGESMMRKYHVGRKAGGDEEDYSIYTDETIMADLRSFQLRLRDTVRSAITQANFNTQLLKLRESTEKKIPNADIEAVVENVTRKYTLSKEEGKNILTNLWKEGDTSAWGLSNAVTALVHDTADTDRQYELEKAGNELAFLNDRDWKSLIKIA